MEMAHDPAFLTSDGDYLYQPTQEEQKIMWWGYLHCNGKIQVKRWFGDHKDYTEDCEGNDFVISVVKPFAANSREEAWEILTKALQP
jgi:hypothetical protein